VLDGYQGTKSGLVTMPCLTRTARRNRGRPDGTKGRPYSALHCRSSDRLCHNARASNVDCLWFPFLPLVKIHRITYPATVNYATSNLPRTEEKAERIVDHFSRRYGPGNPPDIEGMFPYLLRKPIPAELMRQITCPVLILRGGMDTQCPQEAVESWKSSLSSSKDGPVVRVVAGAPHILLWTDASIADRFISEFLKRARS